MKVYVLLKKYDGGAEYGSGASVVGVYTTNPAATKALEKESNDDASRASYYSYEYEIEEHMVKDAA